MSETGIDTVRIMKLRLAVARFGEMDNARWWNTKGVLGELGEIAYRRGFPKSHVFARARAVFAVAASRCDEVFAPPDAVTLWHLPPAVEDGLEDAWAKWLEEPEPWLDFLRRVEEQSAGVLLAELDTLELISDQVIDRANRLRRADDLRSIPVRLADLEGDEAVSLLAAAFCCCEKGQLSVPYSRAEEFAPWR